MFSNPSNISNNRELSPMTSGVNGQNSPFNNVYNLNNTNGTNNESQFAPSFLFGASNAAKRESLAAMNRQPKRNSSGSSILKSKESFSNGLIVNKNLHVQPRVHWSPVLTRERSASPNSKRDAETTREPAKQGTSFNTGPPLRSYYDELSGPCQKQSRFEDMDDTPSPLSSLNKSATCSGNSSTPPINSNERDFWITVFGFPLTQKDNILELFSKHGDIMDNKLPYVGNWIHIRYGSSIHAQQAIGRNGNLFNGYMIGVVPCSDAEIVGNLDDSQYLTRRPTVSTNNLTQNGTNNSFNNDSFNSTRNNSDFNNPSRSLRRSIALKNANIRSLNGDVTKDSDATPTTQSSHNDSFLQKFFSYWN